jgi:hypothetical protein
MNLPKQSRPVIRDVSREPIRARVQGAQVDPVPNPWFLRFQACLNRCRMLPGPEGGACASRCYEEYLG